MTSDTTKRPVPIEGWEYLSSLPAEIAGFALTREECWIGNCYRIFSYSNEAERRSVRVLYESATKEFMVRICVGLSEFYEINFIRAEREIFEKILRERFINTIEGIARFDANRLESAFRLKKIMEWPFGKKLPHEMHGFSMFICPTEPLQVLNGSYIIADYSDFSKDSSLRILHNVFRDDFFAERIMRKIPQATNRFDCHQLNELEKKIEESLELTLSEMRAELG